jgi:hypothetical protein
VKTSNLTFLLVVHSFESLDPLNDGGRIEIVYIVRSSRKFFQFFRDISQSKEQMQDEGISIKIRLLFP